MDKVSMLIGILCFGTFVFMSLIGIGLMGWFIHHKLVCLAKAENKAEKGEDS